jgi:hypothetical protein
VKIASRLWSRRNAGNVKNLILLESTNFKVRTECLRPSPLCLLGGEGGSIGTVSRGSLSVNLATIEVNAAVITVLSMTLRLPQTRTAHTQQRRFG